VRIRDWRFVFLFLIFCGLVESCFSATTTSSPLLVHKDPKDQKEFQNLYQTLSRAPSIFLSAGAPGNAPQKIGDIDVSTTTGKVYISTAIASSASWALLN